MYGTGSRNQLLGKLRDIAARRCCLDADEARLLSELHELDKAGFGKARPVDLVDVVCERTRMSRSEARRRTARVGLLSEFPALLEALAGGTLNADHVDALVRAVPKKYWDALGAELGLWIDRGSYLTADDFADALRRWVSELRRLAGEDPEAARKAQRGLTMKPDRASGMTRLNGLLDPETAALARNALAPHEQAYLRQDQQTAADDPDFEPRTAPQRSADALAEVCQQSLHAEHETAPTGPEGPTVVVAIGLDELTSVAGEGEALSGGPVSAETARRMACEGGLIPAVLNSAGAVLDLGRRTRLATPAQRLALQIQHRGCAAPGCDAPFDWCHIHHLTYWENGGTTDLDNMIPLCTRHHTLIHQGKLDLPPPRCRRGHPPRRTPGSPGSDSAARSAGSRRRPVQQPQEA